MWCISCGSSGTRMIYMGCPHQELPSEQQAFESKLAKPD